MQRLGIVGAGLLGRLLAWRLGQLGHAVTVFDPAAGPTDQNHAAGWTAAGMLSPWAELECADQAISQLGLRSLPLWAALLPQLPQPVYFQQRGSLLLAHQSDLGAAQRLIDLLRAKMPNGLVPTPLDAAGLQALEPAVHGPSHAWLLPDEGQIHTVQAMQALAAAADALGVQWRWGSLVRDLVPGRIDAERFDHVFDVRGVGASGAVAAPLAGLRGERGELLWLHAPGLVLRRPLRLIHPRWRVYLVPRPDDVVVVGASEIESADRAPISVRTLLGLLSAAHSVLPELSEASLLHTATNLRPALFDHLPQISQQAGLTIINGLFRHGWLIAPALVEDALQQIGLLPSPLEN